MFAVVKTGGKQYRVVPGDIIIAEKLMGDPGTTIKLNQVLMVGEDGKSPEVGSPLLGNNAVNCLILDQSRADKILVFKKKRRKGYKRTRGHRQDRTVLRVIDINGKGEVKPAKKQAEKTAKKELSKAKATTEPPSKTDAQAPTKKKIAAKKKTSTKKKTTARKKVSATRTVVKK